MTLPMTACQVRFAAEFDAFCREYIAPFAAIHDRSGVVSPEVWSALKDYGYFGLFHATALGGRGADAVTMGLAIEILGRYCASTAYSANVSTTLYGKVAAEHLTVGQHDKWLSPVLTGEKIGCFMITEPNYPAADFNAHTTTIKKVNGRYLLNGKKAQVGNGPVADVGLVYAVVEEHERRGRAFALVDMRRGGVHAKRQQRNFSLRAMPWAEIVFSDYEVMPDEILVSSLDQESFSLWSAMKEVDWGKILVYMTSLGVAGAAVKAAVGHIERRQCFGHSFKHLQGVQAATARMKYLLDAARASAYWAIWVKTTGGSVEPSLSSAKVFVTEASLEICRLALSVYGGYGINGAEFPELPAERFYRDSMAGIHAGITTDMALDLLVCDDLQQDGFAGEPAVWLRDNELCLNAAPATTHLL